VDTNVIIDLLTNREGADAAAALIDGAERGEYKISVCSLSYTNIYYSLRKYLSHEQRINCLIQLCEVINTLPVNGTVITAALRSGWKDFEDSVQYHCALVDGSVNGIVTRNGKDFLQSSIDVIYSYEFLKH
ncbi:MAG: PIN domain-containing protein, partial [Bacteroidales bacterium]|nr:PIN domain-containing protein [Bacteroidales bacterium]